MYLAFKGEYKEFTIIRVNFNTVKREGEEHPYEEDNLYLELNNAGYHGII